LTSKFKVKRRDGLLLAVFHAVVGILELATLVVIDIRMMWIGALAILSLIAAYGLLTARKWAVWLVIGLFFPQAVFGLFTLYGVILLYSLSAELIPLLMEVSLGAFLVLSLVSFIYVAAKRKTFEA
jgi:uncharacterized membrane protein (DUF2068 family)